MHYACLLQSTYKSGVWKSLEAGYSASYCLPFPDPWIAYALIFVTSGGKYSNGIMALPFHVLLASSISAV